MHSPRLAASLASAVFVTALSATALAGELPAPDFEDWDASPASVGTVDRAPTHLAKPKRAPKAQLPAESREEIWYGEQILAVDFGSIFLALPTFGVSLAGLVVGGPIVHWAHGNPGRAVGSLALRGGMGGLGAMLAFAVSEGARRREDEECARKGYSGESCYGDFGDLRGVGAAAIGFAVGLIGASVIDATVLAWEDAPAATPTSTGLRVAPTFAMVEGGGTLGIVGVF